MDGKGNFMDQVGLILVVVIVQFMGLLLVLVLKSRPLPSRRGDPVS